jgi:hypothetical protein
MGSSDYNEAVYRSRIDTHKKDGTDVFTHTANVRSGRTATKVHKSLDPSALNKAGKNIRESLDSTVHPDSVPVAVMFDVTGSMSSVPRLFIEKLPNLMSALVKKGYLKHPHILFTAIGDATCDRVPLQVGQFEGGNEMDEALANIYLEGAGGGQQTESYELAMYYMSRHTDLDSVNKRKKKGFLFLIGDEMPYSHVKKHEVARVIGDTLQVNIPTKEILEELRKKFEVIWILPAGTSNFNDSIVNTHLKDMFGQNFYKLDNPEDICEFIISTIGLYEGYDIDGIKVDLEELGASKTAVSNISKSLVPLIKKAKAAKAVGNDSVVRL